MANRFLNNITINDAYTLPSTDGSDGQAIITDGAGNLSFGSVAAASADSSESTHLNVKNTSGSLIAKGTPVYITGNVGNTDKLEIAPADASSASTMPAVGLLEADLANNGEGFVVQGGLLKGLVTATIDGTSTSSNDTVYVKSGGGLTMTKPTGASNLIQNIAKVARTHASNGSLVVSSILRANDVPNLPEGKIWVGDGNTIESTVVFIDETNNYFGLNNVIPTQALDVTGNILASGSIQGSSIIKTGGLSTEFLKADGSIDSSTYLSSIPNSGVTSGTYGDASNIPQITIGADGRITSAADVAVSIPAGTTVGVSGSETSGQITLIDSGGITISQSGGQITFSSSATSSTVEIDTFTGDSTTTQFTLSSSVINENNTQVYFNGVYQSKSNYSTSGTILTFNVAPPNNITIEVIHLASLLSNGLTNISDDGTDITIDNNLTVGGTITATGDIVSDCSSDERLKDNISVILNPIDKIKQIKGVEFDWNNKQSTFKGHDIGVVAQDIEKVLPELVNTRDNGYKAVKYDKLTALLIEAIKQQQEEIEELKKIILK